ncbi:hypothetical protein JL49_21695 [Pseudoalteromonas luteoviolacea]|nr:hypothetical protein JL49_21695 [Pseudoalteromonas luteoviolacea]
MDFIIKKAWCNSSTDACVADSRFDNTKVDADLPMIMRDLSPFTLDFMTGENDAIILCLTLLRWAINNGGSICSAMAKLIIKSTVSV